MAELPSGPAVTVARSFNSAASELTVEKWAAWLPFFAANWRMGSDREAKLQGKELLAATYQLVGTIWRARRPEWDELRSMPGLCCILTRSSGPATATKTSRHNNDRPRRSSRPWEEPPESGAPPPTGDDMPRSPADLDRNSVIETAESNAHLGSRNAMSKWKQNRRTQGPPILNRVTRDAATHAKSMKRGRLQ